MTKILFLFNHDAPHQVAHLSGIVQSMRELRPNARIICATSTASLRACLRGFLGERIAAGVEWLDIGLPSWLARLLALPNAFARSIACWRSIAMPLGCSRADLLVSAERTCLRLRRHGARGVSHPVRPCATWRGRPVGHLPPEQGAVRPHIGER